MPQKVIGKKILILGRVQGVFFRRHAKAVADRLELYGWIKNNDDGSIEAFAYGKAKDVDEFIEWCRSGPDAARVEEVRISSGKLTMGYSSFEIID